MQDVAGLFLDLGLYKKEIRDFTRAGSSLLPIKLKAETCGINTKLKDSILNQGVKIFNSVPQDIKVILVDLDTLKVELDKFLQKISDQSAIPRFVPGSKEL